MWRPRPRSMVRGPMIGVAIAALALAGIAIPLHRLRMADYHRDRATILEREATRGELMCMTPKEPEGPYIEAVTEIYGAEAGRMQKRDFKHRRLARAYRRLAYRPWLARRGRSARFRSQGKEAAMSDTIRLLIDCPDHRGVVAAVSNFIALHNGNIVDADQHVSDPPGSRFFMRMEVESQGFGLGREEFDAAFSPLARQHGMNWRVRYTDRPRRVAIMVSKYAHCLLDLLWRWEAGELDGRDPAGDLQPSGPGRQSPGPRHPVRAPAGGQGRQGRAGGPGRETPEGAQRRPRRAGPLHADPLGRIPRRVRPAGHQHPPLVPAGVHRRQPVPPGLCPRREDHRRDGALRHAPSSTPGRSSTRTSRTSPTATASRTWSASAARSSAASWPRPSDGTSRTASSSTASVPSYSHKPFLVFG